MDDYVYGTSNVPTGRWIKLVKKWTRKPILERSLPISLLPDHLLIVRLVLMWVGPWRLSTRGWVRVSRGESAASPLRPGRNFPTHFRAPSSGRGQHDGRHGHFLNWTTKTRCSRVVLYRYHRGHVAWTRHQHSRPHLIEIYLRTLMNAQRWTSFFRLLSFFSFLFLIPSAFAN